MLTRARDQLRYSFAQEIKEVLLATRQHVTKMSEMSGSVPHRTAVLSSDTEGESDKWRHGTISRMGCACYFIGFGRQELVAFA